MRRMPPRTTAPVSTSNTTPGRSTALHRTNVFERRGDACSPGPCCRCRSQRARRRPRTLVPSQAHWRPRPLRITYIGPADPAARPCRARGNARRGPPSAYLVAMPTSAVIHIQYTAPGPPSAIAVATPAMLPTPIVAARQVISAEYGVLRRAARRRRYAPARSCGTARDPPDRHGTQPNLQKAASPEINSRMLAPDQGVQGAHPNGEGLHCCSRCEGRPAIMASHER